MHMKDCGHDIYGENRPFHIGANSENDHIIVVSNETNPGPIDLNSVFIDEYFFGGVERFVNEDIFDMEVFVNFCRLCENAVLRERIILSYDIFDSEFANLLRKEGVLATTFWPSEAANALLEEAKIRLTALGSTELNVHI